MKKRQSNLSFRVMALLFKVRDFFHPRADVLNEVGIEPGYQVLDYGCGPGSYIVPLSELVGESGKIYALDMHPLAIDMVQKLAANRELTNVKTIHSGGKAGLPDGSTDVALFYDILHELGNSDEVLAELRRVLKEDGILSVSDHHLKEGKIVAKVTDGGLFRLAKRGERTLSFVKQK